MHHFVRNFSVSVLLGLALVTLAACDGGDDQEAAQAQGGGAPQAMPVTVATPLQARVQEWDEFSGRFEATEKVEIRSRVNGYLSEIHFKDGDVVEKGDLLFTIDQRPFLAALKQAEARLSEAKNGASLAQREFSRYQKLKKEGFASDQVYDQRLEQRNSAGSSVKAAEAAVDQAKLDMDFTEIRAPISGRISRHMMDVGNLISAGTGTSVLTTIVAQDPIYFYFDVDEQTYLKYVRLNLTGERPGSRDEPNPVAVSLADKSLGSFTGRMDFIDNEVNSSTGTMRGRALIDNPDYIITPGLFGKIRIPSTGTYDATLIPDAAVQIDQSRKFVYIVGADNIVDVKNVEVGGIIDGLRAIKSGLEMTDKVVINGLQRVRKGAAVMPDEGKIEPVANAGNSTGQIVDNSSVGVVAPAPEATRTITIREDMMQNAEDVMGVDPASEEDMSQDQNTGSDSDIPPLMEDMNTPLVMDSPSQ
ncbi:MAG: efflux RND transporter periplasmic adaptor subunit [Pseudobdellovibrionaceae bacterium]